MGELKALFCTEVSNDCVCMPMTHLVVGLQHRNHFGMLRALHLLQ